MRFLIPLVIGVLLVACGGGGDTENTLSLRGGDTTEEQFRTDMRAFLIGGVDDAKAFCDSLDGLSNTEIAETLKAVNEKRGVIPKQSPDPADEAIAGGIVKEECNRIN